MISNQSKFFQLIASLLILGTSLAHAQNLVPNPSFEDYKKLDCITVSSLTRFSGLNPQPIFDSLLYDWIDPTYATVNLLSLLVDSTCSQNNADCFSPFCTANPIAFSGMYPKDGNNIALIVMLDHYKANVNGRSYLQVRLDSVLKSGRKYLAGCYHAYSTYGGDGGEWACNNLGMHFSPQAIGSNTFTVLDYKPQVNQNEINADVGKWQKLYGCFTAKGDEQYLTIGNFFSDKGTKVELIEKPYDIGADFSTRLIDSVFLEEIRDPFIPNVITPNGDKFNETFVIENIQPGWWSLAVYNRWGSQVYQSLDYRNTWSGDNLSSGVYYYDLQHRCPGISYKGTITILK